MFFNFLKMKIFLLFIFSVFFCLSGISQILTVLDSGTKKPIELATISCEKAKIYALTNDEGYNALLKIKENTEFECAVAMSLALVDEKNKLGMFVDEDDELKVSLSNTILFL